MSDTSISHAVTCDSLRSPGADGRSHCVDFEVKLEPCSSAEDLPDEVGTEVKEEPDGHYGDLSNAGGSELDVRDGNSGDYSEGVRVEPQEVTVSYGCATVTELEVRDSHNGDYLEDADKADELEGGQCTCNTIRSTDSTTSQVGRRSITVDRKRLMRLLQTTLSKGAIATTFKISRPTLNRILKSSNLTFKRQWSNITDGQLDEQIGEAVRCLPYNGERKLAAYLRTKNLKIQRWRLREAIQRVDPEGHKLRKAQLQRRFRSRRDEMSDTSISHAVTDDNLPSPAADKRSQSVGSAVQRATDDGDKRLQFTACDKRCNDRSCLNQHKEGHAGDKPHQYTVHDKVFRQQPVLNQHRIVRRGDKLYRCEVCDGQFSRQVHLNLHMNIHRNNRLL